MLGCAVSPSKEDGSADLVACPLFHTRGVTEGRAAGAGRAPGGCGAGERRLRQAARLRLNRAQTVMVQYKVNSVRKAQGRGGSGEQEETPLRSSSAGTRHSGLAEEPRRDGWTGHSVLQASGGQAAVRMDGLRGDLARDGASFG